MKSNIKIWLKKNEHPVLRVLLVVIYLYLHTNESTSCVENVLKIAEASSGGIRAGFWNCVVAAKSSF